MLLPLSLDKLIDSFILLLRNFFFPYLFIKKIEDLKYTGEFPDLIYFTNINKDEYIKLSNQYNNDWKLKLENSKYMYNDVKSLFEIIDKFSKEIFFLAILIFIGSIPNK